MGYITLIIAVVAIIIISFVFGRNNKKSKNISFPKPFSEAIGAKEETIGVLIEKMEKSKEEILEIMKEEIAKQRQMVGPHLGDTIKGITIHDVEKRMNASDKTIDICLNELKNENKIRLMKISSKTAHYILAE